MPLPETRPEPVWQPARPKLRPGRLLVAWIVAAVSVYVAAGLVPGFGLDSAAAAFVLAAVVAAFNAVLPPLVAALRLPFTFVLDSQLVVHGIWCGFWYWGNPTPEELRQALRAITRERH